MNVNSPALDAAPLPEVLVPSALRIGEQQNRPSKGGQNARHARTKQASESTPGGVTPRPHQVSPRTMSKSHRSTPTRQTTKHDEHKAANQSNASSWCPRCPSWLKTPLATTLPNLNPAPTLNPLPTPNLHPTPTPLPTRHPVAQSNPANRKTTIKIRIAKTSTPLHCPPSPFYAPTTSGYFCPKKVRAHFCPMWKVLGKCSATLQ